MDLKSQTDQAKVDGLGVMTKEQIRKGIRMDLSMAFEVIAAALNSKVIEDAFVEEFHKRQVEAVAKKETEATNGR